MDRDVAAVAFDLDRTLCTTAQDQSAMLATAFERAGVEQFCTIDQLSRAADHTDDADSDVDFYRRCLRHVGREHGVDAPYERIARAFAAQVDPAAVEPLPGAVETVEWVADRYPTALLTNGAPDTQRAKLHSLGVADAFDAAVFGDPERGLKPEPAPFEATLDALGTAPERTLYVGDAPEADVLGAARVGMPSAWVPFDDPAPEPPREPTHRLARLADLPDVLG
jgi:HAD superfamily hydrolase (TIGR01549 family)